MDAELESTDLARAQRIGRNTGVAVAIIAGLLPIGFVLANPAVLVSLIGATGVVALFARRIGGPAGEQIARRPFIAAPAIGALCGLAALLVAGVTASLIGFIWSRFDRANTDWLYSYMGKPFVGVFLSGLIFAIPLGIIAGVVIRVLARRKS